VNAQIPLAFLLVPSERTNAREQFLNCIVFRHSKASRGAGCDTSVSAEVRYDGFEALPRHPDFVFVVTPPLLGTLFKAKMLLRPYFGEPYIQMYELSVKFPDDCPVRL